MSTEEIQALQDEEIEVLESIYDGDPNFSTLSKTQYQYKFGEDGASKSFILDLVWGPDYPNTAPQLSLDTFYNDHVLEPVKKSIVEKCGEEAQAYLGMSMTFSLFEWVKESLDQLLQDQPNVIQELAERVNNVQVNDDQDDDDNSGRFGFGLDSLEVPYFGFFSFF